jgi:hypothetical protein
MSGTRQLLVVKGFANGRLLAEHVFGVLPRALALPIRQQLADNRSFGPEDLDAMERALAAALAKLGLNDRSDPRAEIVARRIVRAALNGERSPITLCEIAVDGAGDGRAA